MTLEAHSDRKLFGLFEQRLAGVRARQREEPTIAKKIDVAPPRTHAHKAERPDEESVAHRHERNLVGGDAPHLGCTAHRVDLAGQRGPGDDAKKLVHGNDVIVTRRITDYDV